MLKYHGLFNIISWDDMVKLVEEADGDLTKKRELLAEIALRREEEEEWKQKIKDLKNKESLAEKKLRNIEEEERRRTFQWEEYEDYDERVRIFKKRLAILLKPDDVDE